MFELNRKTIIIIGAVFIIALLAIIILFPRKSNAPDLTPTIVNDKKFTPTSTPVKSPEPSVADTGSPAVVNSMPEAERIESEANSRDKVRVQNILQMAILLSGYTGGTFDSTKYPSFPVSSDWVNLNNKENPVVKKLRDIADNSTSLAIPKVFDVIDPLAPNFYYAYKSADGKTCQVSAILEAKGRIYKNYCEKSILDKCVYIYKIVRPVFDKIPNIPNTAPVNESKT